VIASSLSLIIGALLLAQPQSDAGSIGGLVVNSFRDNSTEGSAEVVLRVELDGEFVVVEQTTADRDGRFRFEGLPLDQGLVYLPGANRDGVHYPGPRIRLSKDRPNADVVLRVQETIAEPNPLVIRDWELLLVIEPGVLRVTENLVIENPEPRTYVGRTPEGGAEPVTLQLGISPDFERVTFDKEYFGRQFALIGEKLATDLPWTPGRHQLGFTYVLRNDGRRRIWTRPLDLPCQHVRLTVHTSDADAVSCNLGASPSRAEGTLTFDSNERELQPGFVIQVELSRLPVSVMIYARWIILAALALMIAGTLVLLKRRGRSRSRETATRVVGHPRRKSRQALRT
jgi:hypothetical protein